MRKYETIFVLKPNLDEDNRKSLIDRFVGIINSDGEVSKIDEWGDRKLPYEIRKIRDGYFVYVLYNASTKLPAELERNFKITDSVLRYMTTRLDK